MTLNEEKSNLIELSEEEIKLINTFREQKRVLNIENKINKNDGDYEIEKIILKYTENGSVEIRTSYSSYSDFDYELGKGTGEYHFISGSGYFNTTLNKAQIKEIVDFLNKILEK